MRLSGRERSELAALHAKVATFDPGAGKYPHWTQVERDRVRALMRKESPALLFAPSTEEIARLFGRRSQRGGS